MKTTRSHKHSKDEGILISMAESIGSTLGSIAAKADAAQKALTRSTTKVERESKKTKLARTARRVAAKRAAPRRRRRAVK